MGQGPPRTRPPLLFFTPLNTAPTPPPDRPASRPPARARPSGLPTQKRRRPRGLLQISSLSPRVTHSGSRRAWSIIPPRCQHCPSTQPYPPHLNIPLNVQESGCCAAPGRPPHAGSTATGVAPANRAVLNSPPPLYTPHTLLTPHTAQQDLKATTSRLRLHHLTPHMAQCPPTTPPHSRTPRTTSQRYRGGLGVSRILDIEACVDRSV